MASRNWKLARQALEVLAENPDDTAQAIVVIAAMSGNSNERLFKRFKKSPRGQQILDERRDLFEILCDRERLLAMPQGSLGRTICEWFMCEDISAEGLAGASEAAAAQLPDRPLDRSEEARVFGTRLLNLHDVFHVLTGYGRDMRGEVACLAFTFAQTWNTGLGYLVFRALKGSGWRSPLGLLTRQAFRRGRQSQWLIDQDWEALLTQPLETLRTNLGIGPAPVYQQVRSPGAPDLTQVA